MISAFSQKKNELLKLKENGGKPQTEEVPETSDDDETHQPSIQELADRDQEEHMRHIEQEEYAPTLNKPAQPAKTAQDELTPEKIVLFKEWVARQLSAVKDTDRLNALWEDKCAERMIKIRTLDEKAHKEISALYVKRQNELGAKGGTSFKRVTNQD